MNRICILLMVPVLIAQEPPSVAAHLREARNLIESHQFEKARAVLKSAGIGRDRAVRLFAAAASSRAQSGDSGSAAVIAQAGLESYPEAPDLLEIVGTARMLDGRFDEASSIFRRALVRNPRHARSLYSLGVLNLHRAEFSAAEALLKDAEKLDPSRWQIPYQLHLAYIRLSRPREALFALRKAAGLNPKDAALRMDLADYETLQGNLEAAIAEYKKLLSQAPKNALAWIELAIVYFRVERTDEALQAIAAAFRSDTTAANAAYFRTLSRRMPPEDLAGLANDTKTAAGLPSDGPKASLYLAREYRSLRQFDSAEREYRAYLTFEPSDAEAHLELGIVRQSLAKYEEALESLEQARLHGARDEAVIYRLGQVLEKLGRAEDAEKAFRELLSRRDDIGEAHYFLGLIAVRKGELEHAESELRRAIQLTPDLPEAHYQLGQVLRKQGRVEDAQKALENFEKLKAAETNKSKLQDLAIRP